MIAAALLVASSTSAAGPAAVGYSPSFAARDGSRGAVALLQSDGRLVKAPVPGSPFDIPTPFNAGGAFVTLFQANGGNFDVRPLSGSGRYGPTVTLTNPQFAAATPPAARTPNGNFLLTDGGTQGNALQLGFFGPNGSALGQTAFFANAAFGPPLGFQPRADNSVWVITPEASTVTVRRVTPQGNIPVGRTVIRRSRFTRFFFSIADDGRGGLFVFLTEFGRGRTPPTALHAIHVSGTGRVATRRIARVSGRAGSISGGDMVRQGLKARIVYYAAGRRLGRASKGVFTRTMTASGRLSGKRRLARTGLVDSIAAPRRGGAIRILRRRNGLRLHRMPARGRLGRGRLVTRSAVDATAAIDGAGRAYVFWERPNRTARCRGASRGVSVPPRDLFARLMSGRRTRGHFVSRCIQGSTEPLLP